MIRDHLHENSNSSVDNTKVFNKTYTTIENLAKKVTEMECAAFDISDEDSIRRLVNVNAVLYSKEIIELVNYTIENFKKDNNGV